MFLRKENHQLRAGGASLDTSSCSRAEHEQYQSAPTMSGPHHLRNCGMSRVGWTLKCNAALPRSLFTTIQSNVHKQRSPGTEHADGPSLRASTELRCPLWGNALRWAHGRQTTRLTTVVNRGQRMSTQEAWNFYRFSDEDTGCSWEERRSNSASS